MKGELILPPTYIDITGPLVFLAGPIHGAEDWQSEAIKLFRKLSPAVHLANPRRVYPPGEFVYEKQVDWETHHLRRAGEHGAIFFWLARECEHACERPFGQTSRFELGEWKARSEHKGAKLVVGIDDGFPGAKYVRRRLAIDCPDVPILSSLEETCRAAAKLVG